MISNLITGLGEWNPQLFREAKGKFNKRNLIGAIVTSLITQIILIVYLSYTLPSGNSSNYKGYSPYSRYCTGYVYSGLSRFECLQDALGNWQVNWQLWWLDLYKIFSLVAIFLLLIIGCYLIINDLAKEESNGTLNFIRLSPQSSKSILLGKLLGVPSLLYISFAVALPLHFVAGLNAHISLDLLFSFYLVLGAACFFFYSLALLYGFLSQGLGIFQPALACGSLFLFLFSLTGVTLTGYDLPFRNLGDWLRLFYPGSIFPYMFDSTGLSDQLIAFGQIKTIANLRWYDLSLWKSSSLGIAFILGNYALFSYWIWQGLQRRFHNPKATLLSKSQSYWFSTTSIGLVCGFAVQSQSAGKLYNNFSQLLFLQMVLFLALIAFLSPWRQTLIDWVSYRHRQTKENRSLLKDLIWGEKSPSTLAVAINALCCSTVMLPAILLLPLAQYKIPLLLALLFNISVVIIYAVIAQLVLFLKKDKAGSMAVLSVGLTMSLPLLTTGIQLLNGSYQPAYWLFSIFATEGATKVSGAAIFWSLLSQVVITTIGASILTKKLQAIGASHTKKALAAGD